MPPPSGESEIEIVTESKTDGNPSPPNGVEPTVIIADVFSASAYGNLEKLRKFLEVDGVSLSKPDANGYYALQWASLNNYPHVAQYIIEHGGDVNVADTTRQTALHWAAVRGSIPVADALLQNGARVEAADVNGYRAVHVAAQYGQTAFLNHIIVQYDADFDATDNDGRSPLHWAAYKGFSGTIRLLLFRDAQQGKQDKEGCTPLHWAAIRGNVESCTILVHAGTRNELLVEDKAGFTPAQLASDKGHKHVAFFLSNARRMHGSHFEDKFCIGRFGKTGYAPILVLVILILMALFINSIILSPNFSRVTAVVGLWGWTAVSLAFGTLLMFYRCSSKDPGYIKKSSGGSEKQDPLLSIDLNNSPIWTGNWSQLCPTCKIIRPVRSKHCPSCRHCVEQFDHHCPWISNCVGKKNKWDFVMFLFMATLASFVSAVIAVQRLWSEPQILFAGSWLHHVVTKHPGAVSFLVIDLICFLAGTILIVVQASQIARNITTNEVANAARYGYLRGPEGRFRNPYNHGFRKNCTDFLIQGYNNDEELAWPSLQEAAN